jgi:hypothetical protein
VRATVSLFGVVVRLTADSAGLLERMQAALPPIWKPATSSAPEFSLRALHDAGNSEQLRLEQALPGLEQEQPGREFGWLPLRRGSAGVVLDHVHGVVREFVAHNARDYVFIHAGVVAHHGRALMLPGESFAGKSTLTAALARAGAVYYSDDFAVLAADGLIHPFPEPITLRLTPGDHTQTPHPPTQLKVAVGSKPVPVGLVALAQYKPGASWRPRRLSSANAILELIAHTLECIDRPQLTVSALRRALASAPVLKGERGEADETAPLLLAEL